MVPQIILLEDDPDLLEYYSERLIEHDFKDIISFADTTNIANRVAEAYTKPSILWTDYYISPATPNVFLPELRARKINIPVVIISGKVKFNQLNQLSLKCRLAGYFEKGVDSRRLVSDVAQHLVDLNQDAAIAYTTYDVGVQARNFISGYKKEVRDIIRRILCNEEVKQIAPDAGMHEDTIYKYRREVFAFIGTENVPMRYSALYQATEAQI